MLQIENEYEVPIEPNNYQNNKNLNNFEISDKTQNITDYTEQELKGISILNSIYQNTAIKIQTPKEKNWTIPLLLESPKSKDFQSPDLEEPDEIFKNQRASKVPIHLQDKVNRYRSIRTIQKHFSS